MADLNTTPQCSYNMSRIKGKNTGRKCWCGGFCRYWIKVQAAGEETGGEAGYCIGEIQDSGFCTGVPFRESPLEHIKKPPGLQVVYKMNG
jgi:hypothetical protein